MRSAHDWGRGIMPTQRDNAHRSTIASAILVFVSSCLLAACSNAPSAPQSDAAARARESVSETVAGVAYPLVAIQPATKTLAVGGKLTLSAKLTEGSSDTWMGRFLTWKSSNTAVLAISTTGGSSGVAETVVTAVKAGTATITATTQSLTSGTLTITVGTGVATSVTPIGVTHEPSGMTVVANTGPITTVPPSANGVNWSTGGPVPMTWQKIQGTVVSAAQASTDAQPSGVRAYFPGGQVNDPAAWWGMPGSFSTSGTGWIYARFKVRLEPGMTTGELNANAIKILKLVGPGNNAIMDLWSAGGSDWSVLWDLQGASTTYNVGGNMPSNPITPGSWHQIELLIQPNSSAGAGNGVQTIWIDGVQLSSVTGMVFSGGSMEWTGMTTYAARAVYSGAQSSTTYVDFDDYYIAVK
jgi:hypothetical protein